MKKKEKKTEGERDRLWHEATATIVRTSRPMEKDGGWEEENEEEKEEEEEVQGALPLVKEEGDVGRRRGRKNRFTGFDCFGR